MTSEPPVDVTGSAALSLVMGRNMHGPRGNKPRGMKEIVTDAGIFSPRAGHLKCEVLQCNRLC